MWLFDSCFQWLPIESCNYERSNDYEELDSSETNSSDDLFCIWKYPRCTIGLRFNCVSTEFTAKKHGGEKGIPFRFQVEHYEYDTNRHLESFACQIKVFKMKGADRKHKTDRERIERKSGDDQTIYKPSFPVTKLSYLPNKQVKLFHHHQHQHHHSNHHHQHHDHRYDYDQSSTITTDKQQLSIDNAFTTSILTTSTTIISTNTNTNINTTITTSMCNNSCQQFKLNNMSNLNLQNLPRVEKTVLKDNCTLKNFNDINTGFAVPKPIESPSALNRSFSEFVAPTYPIHRSAYSVLRNISPGISPSPSSSRRLNYTIQPCFQRRRRPRVGDCCAGTCSSCGRSCRSASRWVRTSKNRMMCTNWDNSTNRAKQATLISERRRASHGYENNSHLTELPKSKPILMNICSHQSDSMNTNTTTNTTNNNHHHSSIYELSTSGESSSLGGNDELIHCTSSLLLIDNKYDEYKSKLSSSSPSTSIILADYPLNSIVTVVQSDEDPLLGMSSSSVATTPASHDTGYCSNENQLSTSSPPIRSTVEDIGYCAENNDSIRNNDNNNNSTNNDGNNHPDNDNDVVADGDLCMNKLNSVIHQTTLCDDSMVMSLSTKPKLQIPSSSSLSSSSSSSIMLLPNESSMSSVSSVSASSVCSSTINNTSVVTVKSPSLMNSNVHTSLLMIHCEMTASQVAHWLRQSNFENLVETFKNFTGCDILRLGKEDLLSICGSLEGLRLYNSLYNKPAVPRCTLYVCLKGEIIYHAIMLYEMNVNELRCRISVLLSCRQESIKMICLITETNIPVLLTDELIIQFKDKSTYQMILNRIGSSNKMNLFLKPTQQQQ
ncbi:unnamed protein product [Schistosoma turkestanicum]|nr:unnamed protein product [Schistosoma turkestanicum]